MSKHLHPHPLQAQKASRVIDLISPSFIHFSFCLYTECCKLVFKFALYIFKLLCSNMVDTCILIKLAAMCYFQSESGPKVIKLFSCPTQLSMKFQMLISIKISINSAF